MTSFLCLLFRPKTALCSTQNEYTSEITFLIFSNENATERLTPTLMNFPPCFVCNLTLSENEFLYFNIPFILHFAEKSRNKSQEKK